MVFFLCFSVGHRGDEPPGVDGERDGAQEAQALLQIPDAGVGKRVPFQRLRLETEEVGAGAEPQPHREAGQDMVPEQADEEQEEQPAKRRRRGPLAEQQQQQQRPQRQRTDAVIGQVDLLLLVSFLYRHCQLSSDRQLSPDVDVTFLPPDVDVGQVNESCFYQALMLVL